MPVSIDQQELLQKYVGHPREIEAICKELKEASGDKLRLKVAELLDLDACDGFRGDAEVIDAGAALVEAMSERILDLEARLKAAGIEAGY